MKMPPKEMIEKYGLSDLVEAKLQLFFQEADPKGSLRHFHARFLDEVERPLLKILQKRTANNKTQMAQMLGLHRNTLTRRMKSLGLEA